MNAVRLNNTMKQGWEIKKLGEVCKFSQGIQVPIEEQHTTCKDGMIRFLRIIDFTQNGEVPRYISNVDDRYILHDKEIAIVRYGTPGYVCYGKKGAIANNLFKILPKKDVFDFGFLKYWLSSKAFQGVVKGKQYGAALQAIKFSTINEIFVPIPPLSEQEKIVAELDCLSGIIEKKKQQLKEYDALAQSIFYEMFGNPIDNEKGWEMKKLGDVCKIICGQDYKSVKDDNGKYPIYGTGGIMGYASQYRCPANSIIIGRKGNINNPLFVNCEFWNVDTAFGVVPNTFILEPLFFFFFCKNYDFTKHDVSVTIPSLRRTDIIEINVPCPTLALQQEFASKIEAIEKQKELIKQSIAETETLFNSRMEYYFN